MTNEQYTRCPHCKASFKVSDEQLAAASGRVRCGACMNVFDALAYALNAESQAAPAATKPETKQAKESPLANKSEIADQPNIASQQDEEDELFQDNPEADSNGKASRTTFNSDLSESFLSLDQDEKPSSPYTDIEHNDADPDESWAEKVLEEDHSVDSNSTVGGRREPSFTMQGSAPVSKKRPSISENLHQATQDVEAIDFLYRDVETVKARNPWLRIVIGFASFALVVLLVAQAAWFHYEKLAKYPLAKQGFTVACEFLACELPELADLSKIRSHNLIVRSHPNVPKALIIDAVITNEAAFAQDFPKLALYFSDINDKIVAQQVIPPEQYLSESILGWEQMPSDTPIHISLEIEDPGKEAVNYKIRFFPNKKSPQP